ncbi:MAG: hypothetical protein ABSF44_10475 [Candidatus Bathyarchaeia archaeon]|jgi:hypothetical protein
MTKREQLQTSMDKVPFFCLVALAVITGYSVVSVISVLLKVFIVGYCVSVTSLIFVAYKFYLQENVKK